MRASLDSLWPLLHAFLQEKYIEHIDLAMAELITRELPGGGSEELASFICYLVAATREGHLCVEVQQGHLTPDPREVFSLEDSANAFIEMVKRGALLCLCSSLKEQLSPFIVVYSSYIYLRRFAEIEQQCYQGIKKLLSMPSYIVGDVKELSSKLTLEQKNAVIASLSSAFSLITGGPGTGKTFTAAELVSAFCRRWQHPYPPVILLAAPTGKAAAHLEKNVKKYVDTAANIISGTLHALLSINTYTASKRDPAPMYYDLMIVDEASMIDAALMKECLLSVSERGQLVMMGDPEQLPPVEVGSLFAALIASACDGSAVISSRLTQCLRSDRKQILQLARYVNEKNMQEALAIFALQDAAIGKRDFLDPAAHDGKNYEALITFVSPFFSFVLQGDLDPERVLKLLDRFKVISCLRKGLYGVDTLNHILLQSYYSRAKEGEAMYLPIMIAKNDYSLGLYNGDVGIILAVKEGERLVLKLGDTAFFEDRQNGGVKNIAALSLPAYEYAFCLSVHKSQGSEYDEVLILLPKGSESFGRQALYTAITRAKNKVTISAAPGVFEDTVCRCSGKISGLRARLREKGA